MAPETAAAPGEESSAYGQALARAQLAPLWGSLAALAPFEPRPEARPFVWPYQEVRAHLLEAGRRITAEEAERRVLVLANPGLPGRLQATDSLYAGLQLILPGEVAPAHRHSQSALRFVMEGEGAYTAVDGERAMMRPGDFIITPAMSWHEHGGGSEPVIWMDGLDVPLVGFLKAGFREEPPAGTQAPTGLRPEATKGPAGAPAFSYPYERSREALARLAESQEIDPWRGHLLRYLKPDGGWPMPTLGSALTLLPKGFRTRPYRALNSVVATLVEGRVNAVVGRQRFELQPRDLLAVPGWTRYELEALEESVFFAFGDLPAYQALGLWREEKALAQ